MFDEKKIRKDFPFLKNKKNGRRIVYFDNTATTQKPNQVIEAIAKYYSFENANPHRGIYDLNEKSTEEYESSREKTREFVNAESTQEIIFVRNATEAINLVKTSFAQEFLKKGDAVLTTGL